MAKFKVGDKVRVLDVNAILFGSKYFENGEIYEVLNVSRDGNLYVGGANCTDRGAREIGLLIMPSEFDAIKLVKENGIVTKQYRTEKRKARVGERILITKPLTSRGFYDVGSVLTVRRGMGHSGAIDAVLVTENNLGIFDYEYEVIVAEPTHNENYVLTRLSDAEAEIETLKAKVNALETQLADRPKQEPIIKTPNQRRADVIKQARAFVADLEERAYNGDGSDGNYTFEWLTTRLTFHVNADKGVVTALAHGSANGKLIDKAFAKCAPGDVFNADIGKAIAAGRLYGVKVPAEFYNAPQPTEIVVGMRVNGESASGYYRKSRVFTLTEPRAGGWAYTADFEADEGDWITKRDIGAIIDDTDAQYES
ncbi:hypothetical protein [Sporosarcina sp. SAFN-015]|uniref:hypothetical protein n=1 Tax=Sporosarcina sp. SAFN-015 TaxID=3387274 RepID=UPI003F7D41BB